MYRALLSKVRELERWIAAAIDRRSPFRARSRHAMLAAISEMWTLTNRTSYAAERSWTRDQHGVHWWIVAVRGTFDIALDGRLRLADEQLPPTLAPEYFGAPGESSLRYDSDLLAEKPGTDVVVHAHAHAPRGRPTTTVPVVLRIAALEKQLVVHGERIWYDGAVGLTTTSPRPFVTSPIGYEHTFGGADKSDPDPTKHRIDERNPVGRGFPRRAARLANTPAHTIEYPTGDPEQRGPAGFGPIDRSWMPRRTLSGTYDAKWVQTKKPLLPDDYDPWFAMCAPADQRLVAPLVGGERLALLNVTPEGTLVVEIPRAHLELTSVFGRRREQHGARLVTVLVEPELSRLSLVWQSALRVPAPDVDYLDLTDIIDRRSTR